MKKRKKANNLNRNYEAINAQFRTSAGEMINPKYNKKIIRRSARREEKGF